MGLAGGEVRWSKVNRVRWKRLALALLRLMLALLQVVLAFALVLEVDEEGVGVEKALSQPICRGERPGGEMLNDRDEAELGGPVEFSMSNSCVNLAFQSGVRFGISIWRQN